MNCVKCSKEYPTRYYFRKTGSGLICHSCIREMPYSSTIDYDRNKNEIPSPEMLRSIVLDKAIRGATTSLFLWGIINLGAWFLLGKETREFLSTLPDPQGGIAILIYGIAFIGGAMLLFGIIGIATRSSIVGWLNGLSLVIVGLWNVVHDFAAISALKPHGYTIEKPSTIWIMLGVAQVMWGGKELFRFGTLGSKPPGISKTLKENSTKKLTDLINSPGDRGIGRLKFSITKTSFPFFVKSTEDYTAWLLQDKAVCVEKGLSYFFEIDRKDNKEKLLKGRTGDISDRNGNNHKITFAKSSVQAYNEWVRIKHN